MRVVECLKMWDEGDGRPCWYVARDENWQCLGMFRGTSEEAKAALGFTTHRNHWVYESHFREPYRVEWIEDLRDRPDLFAVRNVGS